MVPVLYIVEMIICSRELDQRRHQIPFYNLMFIFNYRFVTQKKNYRFVATAATIVSGAVAERCKLEGYFVTSIVLGGLVCPLAAFWSWQEDGFLKAIGYQDLAGCGVVHMVGGSAGLIGAMILGPRKGRFPSREYYSPSPRGNSKVPSSKEHSRASSKRKEDTAPPEVSAEKRSAATAEQSEDGRGKVLSAIPIDSEDVVLGAMAPGVEQPDVEGAIITSETKNSPSASKEKLKHRGTSSEFVPAEKLAEGVPTTLAHDDSVDQTKNISRAAEDVGVSSSSSTSSPSRFSALSPRRRNLGIPGYFGSRSSSSSSISSRKSRKEDPRGRAYNNFMPEGGPSGFAHSAFDQQVLAFRGRGLHPIREDMEQDHFSALVDLAHELDVPALLENNRRFRTKSSSDVRSASKRSDRIAESISSLLPMQPPEITSTLDDGSSVATPSLFKDTPRPSNAGDGGVTTSGADHADQASLGVDSPRGEDNMLNSPVLSDAIRLELPCWSGTSPERFGTTGDHNSRRSTKSRAFLSPYALDMFGLEEDLHTSQEFHFNIPPASRDGF